METKQPAFRSPSAVAGAFIALGLIVAVSIGAYAFYSVQLFSGSLSVTGSATTQVTSDQVSWTMSISRQVKASALKSGYDQLADDLAAVEQFFSAHNVATTSLDVSPVSMDEVYNYKSDATVDTEKEYTLSQRIVLSSGDIQGVTAMSKEASDIARSGVIFQTQALDYSYSKLPDLRVSLLADAIRDAKARAAKLAEPSGQTVGPLKSASLGVVQVMSPNSVDVSDYGTYDTSSIDKEIMVTVRASFAIR